jgi:DNA repair protein RadC
MKFEKFIYKKKIKELPKELLPREKALREGLQILSDAELLALSIGSGVKGLNVIGLADKIIAKFGLEGLKNITVEELTKIKGIGTTKALQILAIVELAKRLNEEKEKLVINSPEDVFNQVKFLQKETQEKLICFYTNTSNELLDSKFVAVGSLNILSVKPRDIFFYAIKNNAYGIILVHNHPQGYSKPSNEDINFTKKVKSLALELGFEILDHIIVGKDGYFSFAQKDII